MNRFALLILTATALKSVNSQLVYGKGPAQELYPYEEDVYPHHYDNEVLEEVLEEVYDEEVYRDSQGNPHGHVHETIKIHKPKHHKHHHKGHIKTPKHQSDCVYADEVILFNPSSTPNYLNVLGIRIFDDITGDVTFLSSPSQSSVYDNDETQFGPQFLIKGLTSPFNSQGWTLAHTDLAPYGWMKLTLPHALNLCQVNIFNRNDAFSSRIVGCSVGLVYHGDVVYETSIYDQDQSGLVNVITHASSTPGSPNPGYDQYMTGIKYKTFDSSAYDYNQVGEDFEQDMNAVNDYPEDFEEEDMNAADDFMIGWGEAVPLSDAFVDESQDSAWEAEVFEIRCGSAVNVSFSGQQGGILVDRDPHFTIEPPQLLKIYNIGFQILDSNQIANLNNSLLQSIGNGSIFVNIIDSYQFALHDLSFHVFENVTLMFPENLVGTFQKCDNVTVEETDNQVQIDQAYGSTPLGQKSSNLHYFENDFDTDFNAADHE